MLLQEMFYSICRRESDPCDKITIRAYNTIRRQER